MYISEVIWSDTMNNTVKMQLILVCYEWT